ncbi:hypothetical protein MHTCC0001_14390 [Flavobacteriaceae bacterium MHTCC 0001]
MLTEWLTYEKQVEEELAAGGFSAIMLPSGFNETSLLNEWLQDFSATHHNESNVSLSPVELSSWFDAMEQFRSYHFNNVGCGGSSGMYGCGIDPNIKPDAMIDLYNKAKNNCD